MNENVQGAAASDAASSARARGHDLLILAALLINSIVYVWAAAPGGETARRLVETIPVAGRAVQEGQLLNWALEQRVVPPLVPGYLALCPFGVELGSLPVAIGWFGLAISLGLAVLAASLRLPRSPSGASTACLLFLGGFPVVNALTKTASAEVGGLVLVSCALGLLMRAVEEPGGLSGDSGPEALPSWRAACLLGALLGAAVLCEWSVILYLAGPVAVAAVLLARSGGDSRENGSLKLARGQPDLEAGASSPSPPALASLGLSRRSGAGRIVAARLAVSACVALTLAGPWLLHGTGEPAGGGAPIAAGPRYPAAASWEEYSSRLVDWGRGWFAAAGPTLLPLAAVGALLALRYRPGVTLLLLSSTFLPAAVLPLVGAADPATHLLACPGVAAAAGLGLAGLGAGWKACALGLLALGAVAQVADRTWTGAFTPCSPAQVYLDDCYDRQFYLLWRSSATAREVLARADRWAPLLCEPGGRVELAVHPSEVHLEVRPSAFLYQLHGRHRANECVVYRTVDAPSVERFLNDLDTGYPALVVFSELTMRVRAGFDAIKAWRPPASPPDPSAPPRPEVAALEELCRLSRLRQSYGILETLPTSCGPIWLLVRRDLWAARGNPDQLVPLPPLLDEP